MCIYIIYKTTNLINNKFYIGKHTLSDIIDDGYLGSGKLLKLAISKYGKHNFIRETLEFVNNPDVLDTKEILWINKYINHPLCYNIAPGGTGGNTRLHHTEEQRQDYSNKMRQSLSGSNGYWYGKKRPEISKTISDKNKGRIQSSSEKETRNNSMKRNPVSYNRKPIYINDVYYESVSFASRVILDLSEKQIRNRLKNINYPNFRFADSMEIQDNFVSPV